MKTTTLFLRSTISLAAVATSIFTTARAAEEKADKTPWKITGQLEEACSCDAACPCWFDSKPTKMTCGGGQVLFIQKGNYGKVKLDGLAIANMAQSPEGKSMMESFGKWNFSTNYIDEKANPEQRKALEAIAMTVLPAKNASQNFETKYVPITRKIEGKEHVITIGNVGSFRGMLVEGGLGGSSKVVNPPGGRSVASRIRARQDDEDDLFGFRSKLGLGEVELYVRHVHNRQRGVRKIYSRSRAEDGKDERRRRGREKVRSTSCRARRRGEHSGVRVPLAYYLIRKRDACATHAE
jgi:hypothetical protein